MHGPDTAPTGSSRRVLARSLLFVLAAATFLLVGTQPALGQVDYTGVPTSVPPGDTYVGPYAGLSPGVASAALGTVRPPGPPSRSASMSVGNAALGDVPSAAQRSDPRLVTGWDLVTMAALGLTGVVAFAVSAARYRYS